MMMKHDILMMGVVSNTENKCLSYEMVMAVKDDDLVKWYLKQFRNECELFQALVESLVAAGENVAESDELGQTLVHWAMAEDSKCGEKLLTYILDNKAGQ